MRREVVGNHVDRSTIDTVLEDGASGHLVGLYFTAYEAGMAARDIAA